MRELAALPVPNADIMHIIRHPVIPHVPDVIQRNTFMKDMVRKHYNNMTVRSAMITLEMKF